MKHIVRQLIVPVAAIFLCALTVPILGQAAVAGNMIVVPATAKTDANEKAAAKPAAVSADKSASAAKPAATEKVPAKATASATKEAASAENKSSAEKEPATEKAAAKSAATEKNAEEEPGSDEFQYFEYQVIAVPKKTLATAAESMGLPTNSVPTDELLPAIYKAGGYRVIGYSAGYAAADTPVELKMSRSEFYPAFYILPNDGSFVDDSSDQADDEAYDEEDEEDGENSDDDGDNGDNGDGDDGEYDDEEEEDDVYYPRNYMNTGNNLASIFPFFEDPTHVGNEFCLDIRPPRIFFLESSMRKMNGYTNTDYGEWGRGQSPIFDDNSFSSTLTSTKGKPMIVARASTGSAWTLHVFFTKPLPLPEKIVPVTESGNKLVWLNFQIVRARWNDICAAGNSDGCPAVPSGDFLENLLKSSQLRDFYSPSFCLIPSQDPVTIQLNAKTQFVPLKWIPAQDPGIPAIPLNSESIWTGTALRAAARVLNDGKLVRLDYVFEKTTQTGWRNYNYSFFGEPEEQPVPAQQNRYARPQPQSSEPEILSEILKLPMLDTTAFRQALYLEVGKPVLAARISNPAYQPDTLTLLFVTATIEDAR